MCRRLNHINHVNACIWLVIVSLSLVMIFYFQLHITIEGFDTLLGVQSAIRSTMTYAYKTSLEKSPEIFEDRCEVRDASLGCLDIIHIGDMIRD